ncbi:MAG TPA: transglutaminase-like domain-containing protein [Acidimicrobiia bacterium]|nr:transglutaminase-like domain-containing protein [Acidimicrobiia bacterium]
MTERDDEMVEYYATPGPMTDLSASRAEIFDGLPADPAELSRTVQGLLVHEFWAQAYGFDVPVSRLDSFHTRSAADMTAHILDLNPSPLAVERPVEQRMVGNCRYFSTLSCALLRRAGIPARARCGFAGYFEPGRHVDHWVTEYWDDAQRRWVRTDTQLDALQRAALTLGFDPEDQPEGPFLPGGAAWQECRRGRSDPRTFGIMDMWGLWFVQANVVRDLAALNKMELLPWDVWGRMAFRQDPDPETAALTDTVADAVAGGDLATIRRVYEEDDDLRVADKVFDARFEVVQSLP